MNQRNNPFAPPKADSFKDLSGEQVTPLASRGSRLGAAMIDGVLMMIGFVPFYLPFIEHPQTNAPLLDEKFITIGGLVLLVLGLINLILLSTKGQTIGKKMVGIRIVGFLNNENPGFVRAVLLRIFVNGILGFIPLYSIIDTLMIFGADRRCIHDKLANTKVVDV